MIRTATVKDIDALLALEVLCFDSDRISRRSFRYLLTRANATTQVDEVDGQLRGYFTLLFHTGTSLARLYSLAVHPDLRGLGLGHALIEAAEHTALEHDCISLRLEVRRDNPAAIALYQKLGYHNFGTRPDYYEDHMEAVRFEKRLQPELKPELVRVPYYKQTLDFTCGPASLMMAMKALHADLELSRQLELRLWRESTTVFMTSGHGGCGPFGLALSAYHMGFGVEVYVNEEGAMFLDSVRSEEKKEVMRLVQDDFIQQLQQLPVPILFHALSVKEIQAKFDQGGIPIVLISSYRLYKEKFPHWVVVTGFDDKYIYIHDPYVDYDKGKVSLDSINMPILLSEFEHMARYGKSGQRAAIIIYRQASSQQEHKY